MGITFAAGDRNRSPNGIQIEPATGRSGCGVDCIGFGNITGTRVRSDERIERHNVVLRTQAEFKMGATSDHTVHDKVASHDEEQDGKNDSHACFCLTGRGTVSEVFLSWGSG